MNDKHFRRYLERNQTLINRALEQMLNTLQPNSRLHDTMRYAVTSGGKRLRPILCLAACEAVGGGTDDAMPAAVALELIHTYSLIHDDLPAMDDDDLRRGHPTCHVAFDEATAILAGDALLTLAFEIFADLPRTIAVHPQVALDIIGLVSRAAGHRGMIEGQMRDMAAESRELSIEALEEMHSHKTGQLIVASIQTGAILGGADAEQRRCLSRYGRHIGLAFQIVDDILNVEGDPALMGKASGTDQLRGKSTYPALLGLDTAKVRARKKVALALDSLESFGRRSEPLKALAHYILNRRR